jgi:sensor histidine kinase YesM
MSSTLRTTATALIAASFLALFEIFRTTMTRLLDGGSIEGTESLRRVLSAWLTIVLASPWCAFMARRFPFREGKTGRTLAAHFGGALVFVALHMVLMMVWHRLARGAHRIPDAPQLLHTYAFYVALEMSVYAAIVLVILMLDARRQAAERAIATARLEQHLTGARLDNLQAQIRPHFLFNTLNAIAVLARKGDGPAVDRAIGDLGELLRSSFDESKRHEISLGEELEFLTRYVNLQRIRFPHRLEVEWAIDPETRAAMVPVLLVQPLVENALEHGLATSTGGRVRVAARRNDSTLEIEVADDGPGFTRGSSARTGGIGLANTRERLALLYGTRGTLTCSDRPEGGGLVQIRMPWRVNGGAPE